MKTLICGVTLLATSTAALSGQEPRPSRERIALALQTPVPAPGIGGGIRLDGIETRTMIGPFSIVAPEKRGEFIRVSVPVGEFVSAPSTTSRPHGSAGGRPPRGELWPRTCVDSRRRPSRRRAGDAPSY